MDLWGCPDSGEADMDGFVNINNIWFANIGKLLV
jgi:hypothetical protein